MKNAAKEQIPCLYWWILAKWDFVSRGYIENSGECSFGLKFNEWSINWLHIIDIVNILKCSGNHP